MFITYQATLLEKKQISEHVHYLKFSPPPQSDWDFKAGQYMIFHIPQGESPAARRQYSIASHPSQKDALEFIIEYVENGVASQYLAKMETGQQLTMQGPAGVFVYREHEREPIFLATGTGIAPIVSMIADLLENGQYRQNIYLFWGLKLKGDMYYFEELKQIAKQYPNFHFKMCLSRESELSALFNEEDVNYCRSGRIDKGFEEMITTNKQHKNIFNYYICGSKHVVEAMREYLNTQQIPIEQIFFEKFTL
ncbi:MAG TPA: FAD-binding oxidoreductase [Candidatus Woesebacteria bacterium]|nr:FAD-binding oxidoreductase [Candidatus Woesebacteria bacterium]